MVRVSTRADLEQLRVVAWRLAKVVGPDLCRQMPKKASASSDPAYDRKHE